MNRSSHHRLGVVFLALLLVSSLHLSAVPANAKQKEARFEVGERFPEIVLPSLADGSPTSLAQFRGKKIILHVFASW
ncbi:MAG: TlpA family protein disulfide reductase [Acidobacteriota bacterium]